MPLTFKQRFLLASAPLPASLFLRALAFSWRTREIDGKGVVPQDCGEKRYIYAYWHEHILPMVGNYRDHNIHAMASRSFDGDLVSAFLTNLGFPPPARGSSSRGGSTAVMEMLDFLKADDHVAVTVDGPRGPRRLAQEGVLKLSQLSGREVVPIGCAYSPGIRLRSWDKTLIPLPFGRACFCFGQPFKVDASEPDLEGARKRLQEGLDLATQAAEASLDIK